MFKNNNKFNAKKVVYDNIKFDSKVEFKYYKHLKNTNVDFKVHERYQIVPSFKINGKNYRLRIYTPDFSIFKNGKLDKVVDVKGGNSTLTTDSSLRMAMFMYKYQVPVTIAKYDYKNKKFNEKQL